jgi:YHS domain-containing protein
VIRALLVLALLLAVAWAFWRLVDGIIDTFGGLPNDRRKRRGRAPVKLVRDPVCGTWIDPGASLAIDTRGTTHYFCSAACRDDFKRTA